MKKINSYKELVEEQKRTLRAIDTIQDNIKKKFSKTENAVAPVVRVIGGVSKVLNPARQSLLSMGIGTALNFILRKKILKNAPPILRMSGGVIGKSLIAGYLLKKLVGKKKKT